VWKGTVAWAPGPYASANAAAQRYHARMGNRKSGNWQSGNWQSGNRQSGHLRSGRVAPQRRQDTRVARGWLNHHATCHASLSYTGRRTRPDLRRKMG